MTITAPEAPAAPAEFNGVPVEKLRGTIAKLTDAPELAAFDCPEWSHLNAADAVRFTEALTPLLIAALDGQAAQDIERAIFGYRLALEGMAGHLGEEKGT